MSVKADEVMQMFRRGQSKKQIANSMKITKEQVEKLLVEAMKGERDAHKRTGPSNH